jgi:transposase
MAAECARADVRDERRVWRTQRQVRMREQPHRLVFLDETYVNTTMTRLRGRSRKGQRLRASTPFGDWTTHTFLVALRCHELSAPWILDGPITRKAFDTYIETQLAPTLRQGDVVILDNLAVHKSEKAAQCLQQREAWFLYLPAYSPDVNPIENAFSKLKALLCQAAAKWCIRQVAGYNGSPF